MFLHGCVCGTSNRSGRVSVCSGAGGRAALPKLRPQRPVEAVLPGAILDLSSLVLYGTQAVPVRLKILLDRLFSVLTAEQVRRRGARLAAAHFLLLLTRLCPVSVPCPGWTHPAGSQLVLGRLHEGLHAAGTADL